MTRRHAPAPWIDVSVPLRTGMVHWPGDPSIRIEKIKDLARGDDCTVSHLDMGAHTGTHVDAPSHYLREAPDLDRFPLDAAVGRARVLRIRNPRVVTAEELRGHRIRRGERLLFKTRNSARCWKGDAFVKDFVSISLAAARFLAERRAARRNRLPLRGRLLRGRQGDPSGASRRRHLDRGGARPLPRAARAGRLRLPSAPDRRRRRRSGPRDSPSAREVTPSPRLDSHVPPG